VVLYYAEQHLQFLWGEVVLGVLIIRAAFTHFIVLTFVLLFKFDLIQNGFDFGVAVINENGGDGTPKFLLSAFGQFADLSALLNLLTDNLADLGLLPHHHMLAVLRQSKSDPRAHFEPQVPGEGHIAEEFSVKEQSIGGLYRIGQRNEGLTEEDCPRGTLLGLRDLE
jgi:hypothetical protein